MIWRWFRRDKKSFAKIFNTLFALDLPTSTVCGQFENYIRSNGGRAFPVYDQVYSIPFQDPQGRYSDLRKLIEETARDLNIDLQRLEEEKIVPSGTAAKARSTRVRKHYKWLVKRASETKSKAPAVAEMQSLSLRDKPLGGIPLAVSDAWDHELLSDAEDYVAPAVASASRARSRLPTTHHIAFRVWDEDSRTKFTEAKGFLSEAHTMWRGEYLEPFTFEGQGRQALMLLASNHLCMRGGGSSSFVSVSTSLLQVCK